MSSGGCWRKWRKKPSGHRSLKANCFDSHADALHFSKMESKIKASAAQAVPRTSHRIPIPISCRASSLSVDSQRRERSRTLLFSDSFDPRGFMNNSILCRLFPGHLGSDFERVGLSGANPLSIGRATVSLDDFPEENWLTSSRRRVKACSDFGIRSPASGLST